MACCLGRVGVVGLLLAGTNMSLASSGENSTLHSAFKIATNACQLDVVRVLLRRSVVNPNGNSAFAREINNALRLVVYARRNTTDFIDFLVEEAGADVNTRDGDGRTPLHHAALRDSAEAIMALLRHGAELDVEDHNGKTPLQLIGCSKRSAFEALADAGANINRQNHGDLSLPEKAAIMGSVDVIAALVERKVEVNAMGPKGLRPLHYAIWSNEKAAIESLITAGANVNPESLGVDR